MNWLDGNVNNTTYVHVYIKQYKLLIHIGGMINTHYLSGLQNIISGYINIKNNYYLQLIFKENHLIKIMEMHAKVI